jgi:hypothetical protein
MSDLCSHHESQSDDVIFQILQIALPDFIGIAIGKISKSITEIAATLNK